MSQYSVLSLSDITEISKQYDIQSVSSFSLLSGGSENTNYLVSSESGQFVLTICEQKSKESAHELALLLEHFAQHNFKTSELIRTINNQTLSIFQGKPAMLKVFLEGEIIKDLSNQLLGVIGIEMGRLHKLEAPDYLPKVLGYGKEFFHEVAQYAPNSSFAKWIKEIEAYMQPYFTQQLPKSLIHSDIFYSNIIINKNESSASIMDFEEAANYYRIFDVGMTIIGLCSSQKTINLNKAGALLQGYQQQIDLLEIEKSALQAFTVYAAAAMTFWRHRNFNHTNPNPEMFDHYLGLKVLADFAMAIPKNEFEKIFN